MQLVYGLPERHNLKLNNMILKSINPYTNKIIGEINEFDDNQIRDSLKRVEEAAVSWKKTTFAYRKGLMMRVARQLEENVEILAKTITDEMGKPINESRAELKKCAWVCEHYANDAEVLLQREAIATEAYKTFVEYEPLGAILGIMPWNFPFWQVFRFAAPTIMAGNVVLLKHASNVQLCARAIEDLFEKAGFPQGVFQNLVIGSGKVRLVIEDEIIRGVSLTGSEAAGRDVAAIAGRSLKKTVLELGGSNAFIVLDDADLNKTVEIGIKARMQNAGQSCIAAKRFFVHRKISRQFTEMFAEKLKSIIVGDPMDENTELGPLSGIRQAETVYRQVRQSLHAGANLVTGGKPEKAMYPPTLVTAIKPGMPLFDEEVFGPVAPVIEVADAEEAIALSNRSVYGLGVSLFTNDLKRAEEIIPEFDDGAVFINALVKSDPRLPFGGTKHSGYGRELAINGIREFVNVKTVYIDRFHDAAQTKRKKNTVISVGRPGR